MSAILDFPSLDRVLPTINAPRPVRLDAETLVACLRLSSRDPRWRSHLRAFYEEVGLEIIFDLVREGAVSFQDLAAGLAAWDVEDCPNARWIREMAAKPVAGPHAGYARGDRHR